MAENLARVTITAEDNTRSAFDSLKRSIGDVTGMLGGMQGALAGLGVGFSAFGFATWIKGAIDAQAALDDLSEMTSLTVETLSSLQRVARIGGHSLEGIQGIASRFAKSVAEAAGGNKELLRTFDALGISQERLKNSKFDDIYVEFARKIANAENRTYAIAHATDLAGKSAATAIPFFRDLAEEGLKQGKVTAEQAAAAEQLKKDWNRLGEQGDVLKNKFASDLVPALKDITGAMNEAYRSGGALFALWVGLGGAAANALGVTQRAQQTARVGELDATLSRARAQLEAGRLNPAGASDSMWSVLIPNVSLNDDAKATLRRQIGELSAERDKLQSALYPPPPPAPPGEPMGPPRPAGLDDKKKGGGGPENPYRNLLKMMEQEVQIKKELTATDKLLFELAHMRAEVLAKLSPAELERVKQRAEEISQVQLLHRAWEASNQAALEHEKRQEQANRQLGDFNTAASETIQNLRFETDLVGRGNTERETAIALRKLEQDFHKGQLGLNDEEIRQLEKIYNLRRGQLEIAVRERVERQEAAEFSKQQFEVDQRAAEESRRNWERTNDSINQGLTSAIERGFESGKGAALDFREMLVSMFRNTVLRPVISATMQPVSQGITNMMGNAGIPGMGNGGGGFNFSNPFSGNSFFGGGANVGGMGGAFGAGGISESAITAAEFGAADFLGFGAAAEAGAGTAAIGAGFGATAAAAIPYVGLAIMAYQMLKSKKTPAVGTGVSVAGHVGRGGWLDEAWLGHSQNATDSFSWPTHPHSRELSPMIKDVYKEMELLGKTLGRDTTDMRKAQVSFGFHSQGYTNEAVIQAFQANVGKLTDQLALKLIPNLEKFAKAGESATQALMRVVQLRAREAEVRASARGFVRELPGMLGITSLQEYRDSLAVSEYRAPLDRFSSAQSQLRSVYRRGMRGDLGAVNDFSGTLQQALTIGRDVYTSGPQFQELYASGQRMTSALIDKQERIQDKLTRTLDLTFRETSHDQIAAIKQQTKVFEAELRSLRQDLRVIAGKHGGNRG